MRVLSAIAPISQYKYLITIYLIIVLYHIPCIISFQEHYYHIENHWNVSMTIGMFLLIGTYALFNEERTLLVRRERRGIRGEREFLRKSY